MKIKRVNDVEVIELTESVGAMVTMKETSARMLRKVAEYGASKYVIAIVQDANVSTKPDPKNMLVVHVTVTVPIHRFLMPKRRDPWISDAR